MSIIKNSKKTKKIIYQRMTEEEIDHLLGAALHHESVFAAVTTHITAGQRKMAYDSGDSTAFVLVALHKVAAAGGPGSPEFSARLRSEAENQLRNQAADDDEREQVLEWLDEVLTENKERYSEAIAFEQFPRYLTALEIERMSRDLGTHSALPTPAELSELAESVSAISAPPVTSRLSDLRTQLDARLAVYGGRVLLGLATGLAELDHHTDGLRGLMLMGAKPGSGKTTKSLEIALGVARQVEENQAVVVIVSADMPRDTLYARMLCNLGGIEYSRLVKGSQPGEKRKKGWPHHSTADARKIMTARTALNKLEDRIFLVGADHGRPITAASLNTLVTQAKSLANLPRAFLVIDYLQLLAVPEGLDELAADRHRVSEIQRVIETSRKRGDDMAAVLTISEMRKPVGERKGKDWGTGVEDLMGTARLGYAADAVLLCRSMQAVEMGSYYPGIRGKKGVELEHAADKKRGELAGQGVAPVMFALAKGRDGTHRGKWAEEFRFNTSQFVCLTSGEHIMPSDDDDE